jgi:WD40 repeat protein
VEGFLEQHETSPEGTGNTIWFSTILTLAGLFITGLIVGSVSGWVLVRQTVVSIRPETLPTLPAPTPVPSPTGVRAAISLLPLPKGARLRLGTGNATTVNFSPSGDRLALGTSYGLYLYSFPTLKELWYSGADLQPNRVAFSPDGKLLAVGSLDNTVTLWDLTSYKQVRTLTAGSSPDYVIYLAFSSGGKRLLSRSTGGEVRLWDLQTGASTWQDQLKGDPNSSFLDSSAGGIFALAAPQEIGIFDGNNGRLDDNIEKISQSIQAMALSPIENRLAYADYPSSIHIVTIGKAGPPVDLVSGPATITTMAFSENGQLFAACDADSQISIWDANSGKVVQKLSAAGDENFLRTIDSLQFSPNANWLLASAFQSDEVILWNLRSGRAETLLNPANGRRSNSAFSPDSRYLVYSPYSQPVTIRALNSSEPDRLLKGGMPAFMAAFWPDQTSIAASNGQSVVLYDVTTGVATKAFTAGETNVLPGFLPGNLKVTRISSLDSRLTNLLPLADGKSLLGRWQDSSIGLWYAGATNPSGRIVDAHDPLLSPNGKSFVYIDARDNLLVADPKSDTAPANLHQGCSRPAFSPDSLILAAVCLPRQIVIFNAVSHELIKEIEVMAPPVESLTFSPDGRRLMALYQQAAIIVDVATSQQVGYLNLSRDNSPTLNAQTGLLTDSMAVIGDNNGSISLWNPEKGTLLQTLAGHRQPITSLALSADEKSLLSSSRDGTILLWNLP